MKRNKLLNQLARAQYYFKAAQRTTDADGRWAIQMGAVYFACSVADQLLTLAELNFIRVDRAALKDQLRQTLPHYELEV